MIPVDEKRFFDFYKEALSLYGNDVKSLHWIDDKSQNIRFEIFNKIADLNNNLSKKSALDVGCGFGDLYKFFISQHIEVDYTGIDIIPDFISRAKEKFPEAKFRVEDIFSTNEKYDYIFASGSLNFTVTDSKNYYFSMIKKMFECSNEGLIFNMLNEDAQTRDETYFSFNINEVKAYCETLTKNVIVISDYLPWDFTVYLYK